MQSAYEWSLHWKDAIGILFGSVALPLSIYNWWKARQNEQESRELLYSDERQEAIVLMEAEKAALQKDLATFEAIVQDAISHDLDSLTETARSFVKEFKSEISALKTLVEVFSRFPSKSASHKDIIDLRNGALTGLRIFKVQREIGDPATEAFTAEALRSIALKSENERVLRTLTRPLG